jgi:hypothetical protein
MENNRKKIKIYSCGEMTFLEQKLFSLNDDHLLCWSKNCCDLRFVSVEIFVS